jgi:cob(I)alamin adenosyltransferase
MTAPDQPRSIATRRGDDGTTGLLFSSLRVAKDDLRPEAVGTVDEAVSVLGTARAELHHAELLELEAIVLKVQRELFVVGAELATPPDAESKLTDGTTRVSAAMVDGLDRLLARFEAEVAAPTEFIVPGETRASAALEVARSVVRRAERRAVSLETRDGLAGDHLLPYLNRLADLLWVLARAAEEAERRSFTTARTPNR